MEPTTMTLVLIIIMLTTLLVKVNNDNRKLIKYSDKSLKVCSDILDVNRDLQLFNSTHNT